MAEEKRSSFGKFVRFLIVLFAVFVLGLLSLAVFGVMKVSENVASAIPKVEVRHDVTKKYSSYQKSVNPVKRLILADLATNELIEKEVRRSVDLPTWQWLGKVTERKDLGTSAKITVFCPVVYSFSIDFDDPNWKMERKGKVLYVRAPRLLMEPPRVDPSQIRSYVAETSFLVDEEEQEKFMRDNILRELEEFSVQRIETVRENCRASLREYYKAQSRALGIDIDIVSVSFIDDAMINIQLRKER